MLTLIFNTKAILTHSITQYYNENNFSDLFKQSDELSVKQLNIKRITANLAQFRAQLDTSTLLLNFQIISLSETAINNHHTSYNIPEYAIEQDFIHKRKDGGVALYTVYILIITSNRRSDLI